MRLFSAPLKMRRVPEKAVSGTEYPSRTVEACFLHRMLPKMRRVPQEAFLSTARIFCTVEACFWYRVLSQSQVAAAAEPGVHFSRPPSFLSEKKSNEIGKHGCSYYCENTAYHD